MSGIIDALLKAVVTREIDLGECGDAYAGIKLPVRVNWPRAWKRRRFELSRELYAIKEEHDERTKGTDIDALNKRADENATAWNEWWSGVLLMTPDEKAELQEAMPDPHWEWLVARIVACASEYEVNETKKVNVSRGRTSEEPEPSPPTSGTDSSSQDG